MPVTVSLRRLENDRIEIGVARPQHDENHTHNYPSEKEVRTALFHLRISEDIIDFYLKLLARLGACEQLRFPPMDIPQNNLRSRRFRV